MVMKTKIINDDDDMSLPGTVSSKVSAIQARLEADQTRRPADQSRAGQGEVLCIVCNAATLDCGGRKC